MLALPRYLDTLPQPHYAPTPQDVAALLGPLQDLCPLMVEAQAYGALAIMLHPRPQSALHGLPNLSFYPNTRGQPSAHAQIQDPWLRTGPTGRQHALELACLAFVDVVNARFGATLLDRDKLRLVPYTDPVFAYNIASMTFALPANAEAPLHLATILATLHRILLDGRPEGAIATWNPPGGRITKTDATGLGSTSFVCPGSDTPDRERFHHFAGTFGKHLAQQRDLRIRFSN